jgi:hypothetical protein
MSNTHIFKKTGAFLLLGLLFLTTGLVITILLSSNPNQNQEFSGGSLTSLPTRVPSIKPGDGVQDDLQSEFGPWWLTKDLSWVIVDNPSLGTRRISFEIAVNFGVCTTTRIVRVTSQNQTTSETLSESNSPVKRRVSLLLEPGGSTSVVLQVVGPPCQAPNDPRIFFGQINIANLQVSRT